MFVTGGQPHRLEGVEDFCVGSSITSVEKLLLSHQPSPWHILPVSANRLLLKNVFPHLKMISSQV